MNRYSPLGIVVGCLVLLWTVSSSMSNAVVVANQHAAIIVLGGTLAVALIMFSPRQILNMVTAYLRSISGIRQRETNRVIEEIVAAAEKVESGVPHESIAAESKHEFLGEALKLLSEKEFTKPELHSLLEKRINTQESSYQKEDLSYRLLGKFPPAFGLVGTTLGMIGLLQGLGEPDSFSKVGPSMSLALVATFYGLVLANFILIPIGENISQAGDEDLRTRKIIAEGILMLKDKKHSLLIEEHLKSYLSPKERQNYKRSL